MRTVTDGLTEGLVPRHDGNSKGASSGVREAVGQSVPLLRVLRDAGTLHVYADTADFDEIRGLTGEERPIPDEIDGMTVNQPLVRKVLSGILDRPGVLSAAREMAEVMRVTPDAPGGTYRNVLYSLLCSHIANAVPRRLSAGRDWDTSLQLPMGIRSAHAAVQLGTLLRRMAPTALVKVPFAPHEPRCLLVARELERRGIPVNLTSTFSARQAVAAAMLTDAHRTNVFLGRLNQGLHARLLGEQTVLEAQRVLLRLRREGAARTQLIAASMRDWQTFPLLAGCDAYTAPASVLTEYLEQREVLPESIGSRIDDSYEDRLGVEPEVEERIGRAALERLYRVEREFIEFLREWRETDEYRRLGPDEGDAVHRRFEEAGFADLFHDPTGEEWTSIRRDKLPDLKDSLTTRLPLDTLYSLLADADFEKHQHLIDREIQERSST